MNKLEPEKMTKTERKHWGFGTDALKMIEYDLMGYLSQVRAIPDRWHLIWEEQDKRDPKRVKVTTRLDANVVKFFKDMGPGYQERMNRVLQAFMYFRLAKLIDGPDTMDYITKPEEVMARVQRRPEFGDEAVRRDQRTRMTSEKAASKTTRKRMLKGTERPWAVDGDEFGGTKGR